MLSNNPTRRDQDALPVENSLEGITAWHEIEESRVFFDDVKKNFIFETNITNRNWGYIQVLQELENVIFIRHNLLICRSLGNEKFLPCQEEGFPNL